MAELPGDSNLDDHESVNEFIAWAKSLSGSKTLGADKSFEQTTQAPNRDIEEAEDESTQSKQDSGTAQEHTESEKPKSDGTVLPSSSPMQPVNILTMPSKEPPNSARGINQQQEVARISVISVAHKARRPDPTNKLDIHPTEEAERTLSSMTPTQRKFLSKVSQEALKDHLAPTSAMSAGTNKLREIEFAQSEKDRELIKHSAAARLTPQGNPFALKNGSVDNSKGTISEEHQKNTGSDAKNAAAESKKADGLLNSIHARKGYSSFQTRMPTGGPNRSQAPPMNPNLDPSRMAGGENRDPMTYYDEKQKEYYPPIQPSIKCTKMLLRSKDPNLSMKSLTKKTFAGFDAQAAEYQANRPIHTPFPEAVTGLKQEVEESPSAPPNAEVKEMSPSHIADRLNECAVDSASPSTVDDINDEETLTETPQRERTTMCAGKASGKSRNSSTSEKKFDLTPMLNVLGARPINAADTVAGQELDDGGLPIKPETDDEVLEVVMHTVDKDQQVKADKSRTLILKNLPEDSDYNLVQSMIEGASILKMRLDQEEQCANVKLFSQDDCQRLLETTGSGKVIKRKGKTYTIRFELSCEPDEQDDVLDAYLDCGATRAVQVEDVDMDLTMRALYQLGQGPTQSRVVEAINDSFGGGARSVLFRFISIHDAVGFRASLRRTNGWKNTRTEFAQDPCA